MIGRLFSGRPPGCSRLLAAATHFPRLKKSKAGYSHEQKTCCRIRTVTVIVLLVVLAASWIAQAEDAKSDAKKEEKKKKWESVATVGVTLTRDNSKNFLVTRAVVNETHVGA